METLREVKDPRSNCWKRESEPLFRVWVDDNCMGFPFFNVMATNYTDDGILRLEFPLGRITIEGPKAWMFYDGFAQNRATVLKADGKDITSVTFRPRDDLKELLKYMISVFVGEEIITEDERKQLLEEAIEAAEWRPKKNASKNETEHAESAATGEGMSEV